MRTMCALTTLAVSLWLIGLNVAAERKDLKSLDQKFVDTAASAGMAEVKAGEMARDRATNDDVKKFAEHMVRDHTKANQAFMDVLKKCKIDAPRNMNDQDRTAIDNLGKLRGAAFEREYIRQQLAAHKEAVALFEDEAKNGRNEDLRAFAEKTLPTLREHLKEVIKLAGGDRPEK